MECSVGAVVHQVVKESSKRLEGEKMGVMGLGVHSGTSFICTSGDGVMIRFYRKRCLSISTTHTTRTRDRGARKFGSLKDFDVHDILKKEPRFNRRDASIRSTQLFA
jgi:hypothetical protein